MGADEAGAKSVLFNTITVSDGISMGTPGMRYSLVSREVIADSIETVVGAQGFDGFVAFGGCDKNMPACRHGHGAHGPAERIRLRRHHPAGRGTARHRLRLRSRRRPRGRHRFRHRAQGSREHGHSRALAPAAACTRPTPWHPPSKPWASRCRTAPLRTQYRMPSVRTATTPALLSST